jgi:uncharacterized membrane protein YdbT with pleckstrin-like domain
MEPAVNSHEDYDIINRNQDIAALEREKENSDFNSYASTKSVSQELLNATSIQYLIGLLVSIFTTKTQPYNGITIAAIVAIIFSLVLQLGVLLLIALIYKETKLETAKPKNNLATTLSLIVLIANICVTAIISRI